MLDSSYESIPSKNMGLSHISKTHDANLREWTRRYHPETKPQCIVTNPPMTLASDETRVPLRSSDPLSYNYCARLFYVRGAVPGPSVSF